MAGTILISEKKGLATSTAEFDYHVERIRNAFQPQDRSIAKALYEPLDEGGMNFISAIDFNKSEYQIFVDAVKRAYLTSMQEASFASHKDRWIELIRLVDDDPRNDELAARSERRVQE